MIFWLALKLEIIYRVKISWRILISFRGYFEDHAFAWWNIWVSIISFFALRYFLMQMARPQCDTPLVKLFHLQLSTRELRGKYNFFWHLVSTCKKLWSKSGYFYLSFPLKTLQHFFQTRNFYGIPTPSPFGFFVTKWWNVTPKENSGEHPEQTSTHQYTIHWMPITAQLWMNLNWLDIWCHLVDPIL